MLQYLSLDIQLETSYFIEERVILEVEHTQRYTYYKYKALFKLYNKLFVYIPTYTIQQVNIVVEELQLELVSLVLIPLEPKIITKESYINNKMFLKRNFLYIKLKITTIPNSNKYKIYINIDTNYNIINYIFLKNFKYKLLTNKKGVLLKRINSPL